MPRKELLAEKIFNSLYRSKDDTPVQFTANELAVKSMYEDVFAKWMENPALQDSEIVIFLTNEYSRSQTQAYRDIAVIKSVLGDVRNAAKEWHRYTVIAMIKKAYNLAETKKDIKNMILAADKLGKYTKLDKDEAEEIDWDKMIPPSFEPTADVTTLGLSKIENLEERKEKLRKKYLSKPVDVEYEEVSNG